MKRYDLGVFGTGTCSVDFIHSGAWKLQMSQSNNDKISSLSDLRDLRGKKEEKYEPQYPDVHFGNAIPLKAQ